MRFAFILTLVAVSALVGAGRAEAVEGVWATGFHTTGPNADVVCMLRWNGDVYAGGAFTAVGPTPMTCGVTRLENGSWRPVGDGIDSSGVIDLAVHDDALHALGKVTGGRRVWRLDGGVWTPVGPLLADYEEVIASYQGDLYLGKYRLEDGAWVDRLQTSGRVKALAVHDGLLVAGGSFVVAGGDTTGHVCAWDGTDVIDAYPEQDVEVHDLEAFNGELHAARYSDGGPLVGVQVWRGGVWADVPELGDVNYTEVISDLAAGDGRLLVTNYAFQIIVKADGSRGSSLRAWDGSTVTTLYAPSSNRRFLTAAEADDGAWLGGSYILADSAYTANLGLVRGGALEPVCEPGLGASSTVYHLESGPFGLAVGGSFWTVGRVSSRGVALYNGVWASWGFEHWDDPNWYDSPVALAWNGSSLVTYASGHANEGVGQWLFGSWWFGDWVFQAPADLVGWNGDVVGPSGDAIYAYSPAGDPVAIVEIAGSGRQLLVDAGDLVLGGGFTAVDGVAAKNIARRNEAGWAPIGGGLPETVIALGRYGGQLVAVMQGPGGQNDVNDIMTWDGSAWQLLAQLTGGRVTSLQEYSGCLFLGGYFDMPADDGAPMRGIASWSGVGWESVGEAYATQALAVYDDKLWVAGGFRSAGGVPASRLTYWSDDTTGVPDDLLPPAVVALAVPRPNPFNPLTELRYELPRAAHARLEVFDAAGRRVATLVDEQRPAGSHIVTWTGSGDDGRALPSGTYLVRLRAGGVVDVTKATLVR